MNRITNLVSYQKKQRNKILKKKREGSRGLYRSDIVSLIITMLAMLFFISTIVVVLSILFNDGLRFDYIIACMAALFFGYSVINQTLTDKGKYTWAQTLMILICTVFFVTVMCAAVGSHSDHEVRSLSIVVFIISLLYEVYGFIRFLLIYSRKKQCAWLFVCDLGVSIITIVTLGAFIITFIMICIKLKNAGVMLDFVIAIMSALVFIFSVINRNLSDKDKYTFSQAMIILILSVVYIIVLITAMENDNPQFASIISFVTLFASVICEMKDMWKTQLRLAKIKKEEREKEITEIENRSIF